MSVQKESESQPLFSPIQRQQILRDFERAHEDARLNNRLNFRVNCTRDWFLEEIRNVYGYPAALCKTSDGTLVTEITLAVQLESDDESVGALESPEQLRRCCCC